MVHLPEYNITVIVCYIKPGVAVDPVKQVMYMKIELIRTAKVILKGDFNWDLLRNTSVPCLSEPAFKQHIILSTHRDGGLLDQISTQ